ncbi:HNH endonuclease [Massilia sp. IC2-477]|uniref:HNH endonuclease n=1 Tax=Massilia sp. IC2-477 TaxID=2887198 RepID=UPI001D12E5CF|nr:HNH endonuclease [Massilia sp. IC2-477]MCC2956924.1 HNH endonuclease [Massilia sp. IC2-477]
MTYKVNIEDIQQALVELGGEARAKHIQDYVLSKHCANQIPPNYEHDKSFRQTIQRKIEDYCPQAKGFDERKKEGKFVRIGHGMYRLALSYSGKEFPTTEELGAGHEFVEGATKTIKVNYYERSPVARAACISHYGAKCVICNFNFEEVYGELGKSFIHVHHVIPLSEVKASYVVDPINDLRPVCANCHAIIHRTTPALDIAAVKNAITRKN